MRIDKAYDGNHQCQKGDHGDRRRQYDDKEGGAKGETGED
jgi:hypothetical protein